MQKPVMVTDIKEFELKEDVVVVVVSKDEQVKIYTPDFNNEEDFSKFPAMQQLMSTAAILTCMGYKPIIDVLAMNNILTIEEKDELDEDVSSDEE